MATRVGTTGYIGHSPAATYIVDLNTATRLDNNTMQYTFIVSYNMQYSTSNMGVGERVQFRISVGDGSWNYWTDVKNRDSTVSGTSNYGRVHYTVTAPSSTSGASLPVTLGIYRTSETNSSWEYNWQGVVGNVTTTALLYTACSAPTTITSSTSIGTPGQNITISWSGASAGTNNSIQSYTVFYRYGGQPTTSTYTSYKTVTTTSTSGSTTIPISSTRGQVTYIKIRTNGSAGSGYYSSISTVSSTCTTNSLPNAPSVIASKTTVASSGENVSFTITAGSDTNSGQTRTLYYSTSSTGSKIKINSSPWSYEINNKTTLYFYTYDGLEYSSAKSITINKNIKPVISSLNITSLNEYFYNSEKEFTESFILNPILYSDTTENKDITYYYYINFPGVNLNVATTSVNTYTIHAFQYVKPGEDFSFQVRIYDGIEYSDYIISSTYTAPDTYTDITRHYNQFNNSNISYSNGDFYNSIRVYLPTDSYSKLNTSTVSATYQTSTTTPQSVTSISYVPAQYANMTYENSQYYCDITVPTSLTPGQTYTFTITIKTGSFVRTYTFKKNRTRIFPGGSIQGALNGGTITNPFTSPPTIAVNIPSPVDFIKDSNYDYYNFNLSSDKLEGAADIRLRLSYNNKYIDFFIGGNYLTINNPEPSSGGDTVNFTLPGTAWTYIFKNTDLGKEIIDALNPVNIQASLRITNLFNIVSVYNSNFTFNPRENSTIESLNTKLGTTALSSSSVIIREGQTFNWTYNIKGYNAQSYTGIIQIYRSTNATTPTGGSWTNYKTQTFSSKNTNRNTSDLSITTTVTDSYTIPQLSESKYIFFRLRLTDSFNRTITSGAVAAGASNRHIAPSITITGYNYTKGLSDDTGTISITYTINDNGAGRINGISTTNNLMSLTNSVQIIGATTEENNKITSRGGTTLSNTNNSSATTTADVDNFTESNIQVYVRFKTRLSLDSSISTYDKTFDSVILTIYNINPTIAVRKQYLGINSTAFEDDRVIVIAAGAQGVRKKMVIETEQVGKETYIDVTTGEMFDFIIDGGSW